MGVSSGWRVDTDLDSSFLDGKGAGDFSGTAAIDNAVVFYEIADYTKGVVERTFSFVDYLWDVDVRICSQRLRPFGEDDEKGSSLSLCFEID